MNKQTKYIFLAFFVTFCEVASSVTTASSSKKREMELDFIVMPRFCSSSLRNHPFAIWKYRLSMYRISPARRVEMMPLELISPSARLCVKVGASRYVVFPWSTCARMQMFLTWFGLLWSFWITWIGILRDIRRLKEILVCLKEK